MKHQKVRYLLCHLQQSLIAALPSGAIHGCLLLQLFDLFSHLWALKRKQDCHTSWSTQEKVRAPLLKPQWRLTFSISCLNVVKTSLLLDRVVWNSSNFSVYSDSWGKQHRVYRMKRRCHWVISLSNCRRWRAKTHGKPAVWGELPVASSARTSSETPQLLSAAGGERIRWGKRINTCDIYVIAADYIVCVCVCKVYNYKVFLSVVAILWLLQQFLSLVKLGVHQLLLQVLVLYHFIYVLLEVTQVQS